MLYPTLDPRHYLYRLFHEEGLRVLPVRALSRGCRCSEERIILVLKQLPKEELLDFLVEGAVEVTCEFCNSVYLFDPETFDQVTTVPDQAGYEHMSKWHMWAYEHMSIRARGNGL